MKVPHLHTRHIISGLLVLLVFTAVILLVQHLTENSVVTELAQQFGYVGVVITGTIAGLNSFVPVPAAAFTPVFVNAGLSIQLIIIALAIGTLIADFVGYVLGHVGRKLILQKYPKLFRVITEVHIKHRRLVLPLVAAYAAFVPFPNEALIIPLALGGMRFTHMIIPLMIGNILNQTIYTYSFLSLANSLS
jgi:membrane protein YqaA with SNARE-associated domain